MTAPPWLDELVLRPGPPWRSMGVHPLDLDSWFVIDERYDDELAVKADLLAERPADVFAALSGTEAASGEVLGLVTAWLARHHPERLAPPRLALHPLDAAGRLVQEDLCLMVVGGDGRYRLEAASLCFPSHWRLHDKLGHDVRAIHGPVPHYETELAGKVDTFFDRLRADRPVWRRNFSIHDHDDLFRPEPHESPDSFQPDAAGVDEVWLRSERQALVRLPESQAVLFTIKTQQCPITAFADRPDRAADLAAYLRAEGADLAARREKIPFPPWLPTWLETVAEGP